MAAKRASAASDGSVKRVIDGFYAAFVRHFNPPDYAERWLADRDHGGIPKEQMVLPRIDGAKDGALVKKMIASWGEPTVLRLMDAYFRRWKGGDRRVMRTNPEIGGFWVVAPYLAVASRVRLPDAPTAANLDAADRAARPTH